MAIRLTQKEFLDKCKEKHNNFYIYDYVNYINAKTKIEIECPKHGVFYQGAYTHSVGHGCIKCRDDKMRADRKLKDDDIISQFRKRHGNKYDYSQMVYTGLNSSKIKIICPVIGHGEFHQYPKAHLKYGCSKCGDNYPLDVDRSELINRFNKVHNNLYTYNLPDEVLNSKSKIDIFCSKHGKFTQRINNHLHLKQSCPFCNESKGESMIVSFLLQNKIEFIREKKFETCVYKSKLKFDFYLPDYNILIEFDGLQHFKPIEQFGGQDHFNYLKICDSIKNKWAIDNNINLIRISYTEFKNIEKILTNIL